MSVWERGLVEGERVTCFATPSPLMGEGGGEGEENEASPTPHPTLSRKGRGGPALRSIRCSR